MDMDEELGQERCQRAASENTSPNYCNGYFQKTVKTQQGEIDIKVPRACKGNYEPKIIRKTTAMPTGWRKRFCLCMPAV